MDELVGIIIKVGIGIAVIFQWIQSVTGLVPAICTLIGVFYATRINREGIEKTILAADKRFINQLKFDQAQKDNEREIALRKEVYMLTASGMVKAQKYLANMVKGNASELNPIDQIDDFFSAVAKIDLVGTNETIEKVDAVMRQFSESHYSLLMGSLQLDDIQNDIRVTNEDIEFKENTFERLIASTKNGAPQITQELIKINLEIEALGENLTALENSLTKYRSEFGKKCMSESLKVARLIYPAVVAIRAELHLDLDVERYVALKAETFAKIDNDVKVFLDNLDNGLR